MWDVDCSNFMENGFNDGSIWEFAVFNRNFATLVIDEKLLSKHFFLLTDQNHQLDIFF